MKTTDARIIYDELMRRMKENENPVLAVGMSKYMRNLFPYFGITSPLRKEIFRTFIADVGKPPIECIPELFQLLWDTPQREAQYLVKELGDKYLKSSPSSWFTMYESFITQKSWWDTVDFIVPGLLAPILMREKGLRYEATERWNQSENFWLVRASLIYQLKFKENTDFEQLKRFVLRHADSKEFFINKAAGWALRQYAYTDPGSVVEFVNSHKLSNLTKREALKHF